MFGFKASEQATQATSVRRKPMRRPTAMADYPVLPDGYEELQKQLGLPETREIVAAVLMAMGVPIYQYNAVESYLNAAYGPWSRELGATWLWRPLIVSAYSHGWRWNTWRNGFIDLPNGAAVLYRKPVPLPVLYTIQRVKERLPNLSFFVSDESGGEPISDPFLAVWSKDLDQPLVIECWDEPGFDRRQTA